MVNDLHTIPHLLCESKINEFQMSFGIYEYVLWFQVSVCNPFTLVQEFQDEDNLGCVELRGWLVEASSSPEIAEDFSARTVVELCEALAIGKKGSTVRWGAYHHV